MNKIEIKNKQFIFIRFKKNKKIDHDKNFVLFIQSRNKTKKIY